MFWEILPWIISTITITSMWMAGNKDPKAWVLGLVNQILWFIHLVWYLGQWGLLPISVCLTFVYTRNLLRWRAEKREALMVVSVEGRSMR